MGTAALDDLRAVAQPAKRLHVVILGAGLAGLCAALELERGGHTVTLLEADARHAGGRARTLRFENGLYGDAGPGLSPEAIDFLASATGLSRQMPTAATEHLREEVKEFWTGTFDEIVGGTTGRPSAGQRPPIVRAVCYDAKKGTSCCARRPSPC